jgi:hypothetical protein
MKREKLRLVKSFNELKSGMIVVAKDCLACGAAWCRGMLISLEVEDGKRFWLVTPNCVEDLDEDGVIEDPVRGNDIFIVEDGLEDEVERMESHRIR